jgi:hypothetical protein
MKLCPLLLQTAFLWYFHSLEQLWFPQVHIPSQYGLEWRKVRLVSPLAPNIVIIAV